MTRISTRSATAGAASIGAFRRALALTIAVLVVLGGGLGALDYFHGPKLTGGAIDTSLAVSQPGQQLRLFSNETLAAVDKRDITVSPAAAFTVTTTGQIVSLHFSARLQYSTRYTVRAAGVTSIYQNQVAEFSYSFTTAAASVTYLQRADPATGGQDQIIRTGLTKSSKTVLYSGARLEEFAVFPAAVAVVAAAADGSSTLALVSLGDFKADPILLPAPGIISSLRSNAAAGLLAFEFTTADGGDDHVLLVVDLTAAHTAVPVLAASSAPLSASGFNFVDGSTNIAVQQADGQIEIIDLSVPGGRVVPARVAGKAFLATSGATSAALSIIHSPDALILGAGGAQRTLYTSPAGGVISGYTLSPNGQYVAVTVTPDAAASVSDSYPVDPQSTAVTTVFVDVATALTVRSVVGFAAAW